MMSGPIYIHCIKPMMDRCLAVLALLVLSAPMVLLSCWIKLDSPGPVFFCQDRWGFRGRTFRLWKFRTLRHRPDRVPNEMKSGESDVTPLGYWLRRFRLDEIPNLFNVLLGDLSLVGPRPCLPLHHDLNSPDCQRRLEVLPGCTGMAVAQGGQSLPWEDRWKYDAWYLQNQSLWLDLRILFKSVGVIVWGDASFVCAFEAYQEVQESSEGLGGRRPGQADQLQVEPRRLASGSARQFAAVYSDALPEPSPSTAK